MHSKCIPWLVYFRRDILIFSHGVQLKHHLQISIKLDPIFTVIILGMNQKDSPQAVILAVLAIIYCLGQWNVLRENLVFPPFNPVQKICTTRFFLKFWLIKKLILPLLNCAKIGFSRPSKIFSRYRVHYADLQVWNKIAS